MDATLKERVRARVREILAMDLSDERAKALTSLKDAFPQDAQVVEEIVVQENALAYRERLHASEYLAEARKVAEDVAAWPEEKKTGFRPGRVPHIAKHEPPPTTKITRYEDSVQCLVAQEHPELADAIKARADEGFAKYGTYLGVNNGRYVPMDFPQETLDAMNYGMQGILEGYPMREAQHHVVLATKLALGVVPNDEAVNEKHFYRLSEFQVETLLNDVASPGRELLFGGMRAWLNRRRGGE